MTMLARRPTVVTLGGLPHRAGEAARRLAPWRDGPDGRTVTVTGIVLGWLLVAMLVLGLAALTAQLLGPRIADEESVEHAEAMTSAFAERAVAPLLTADLAAGDPAAARAVDGVVLPRVREGSMDFVRVRDRHGTIVYADEPRLVGKQLPLVGHLDQQTLLSGSSHAERSHLPAEDAFFGDDLNAELVLVHAGLRGADGRRYLFESFVASPRFENSQRGLIVKLAVLMVVLIGALLYLPLAMYLTRRLKRSNAVRTSLVHRARSASLTERRKLAQALHDDVVQDLAGLGYALSASVAHPPANPNPRTQHVLSTADAIVHHSIHRLREILADIYPLHAEQADFARAVDELAEPLRTQGVSVAVTVTGADQLAAQTKTMVYRITRELLRNVEHHAQARHTTVEIGRGAASTTVSIADDGVGFDTVLGMSPTGHVGLVILMDAVRDQGGTFTVTSAPGSGCQVAVTLPDAPEPAPAPAQA